MNTEVIRADPGAPWVVCLHGAAGSTLSWCRQVRGLRGRYNIVLLTLPDHGRRSLFPVETAPHTWETLADGVIAVLAQVTERPVSLVAVSLTTVLAQIIASRYPDRVERLVLPGAICGLTITGRFLLILARMLAPLLPAFRMFALFSWFIIPRCPRARRAVLCQARYVTHRGLMRWMALAPGFNRTVALLRRVTDGPPTLMVMGERDYLFRPYAAIAAASQPHIRMAIIPGASHLCNYECPDQFNRLMDEFLCRPAFRDVLRREGT